MGRDIFHYHLRVVYVPIVQKEILWSKRTKDKSLVGKVKEIIANQPLEKMAYARPRGT